MSKPIFISYRREDSAGFTRAIANELRSKFGKDRVFIDVDTLAPGDDFVERIERTLDDCAAELVVIGSSWLAAESEGRRRLDDPHDYVRVEVAAALRRGIRVIPVLVDQASMPAAEELPEELAPLARRNALKLEHVDFDSDMARLVTILRAELGVSEDRGSKGSRGASRRLGLGILAGALGAAVLGLAVWMLLGSALGPSEPDENPASLMAPGSLQPPCGETIRWPPANHFLVLGWQPVDGASTYTVETDCFGCREYGKRWHSLAGTPWRVKAGLGLRTPIYSSSIHQELREDGGLALRWRVWGVDGEGIAGAKSEWCQLTFSGGP